MTHDCRLFTRRRGQNHDANSDRTEAVSSAQPPLPFPCRTWSPKGGRPRGRKKWSVTMDARASAAAVPIHERQRECHTWVLGQWQQVCPSIDGQLEERSPKSKFSGMLSPDSEHHQSRSPVVGTDLSFRGQYHDRYVWLHRAGRELSRVKQRPVLSQATS